MTRLCIATSYDGNFKAIGDLTLLTMKRYAATYGFDCVVEQIERFERPPAWHRVKLIPEIFDRGYEFVLWLDADALFCRHDENVLDFVERDKNLYLVEHDYPPPQEVKVPNTGVMLVRNCAWSRALFETIWSMTQYLDHPWWENAAVIKLLGYHSLLDEGEHDPDEAFLRHVKFLPIAWNCVPNLPGPKNAIVRHYAGCSKAFRSNNIPTAVFRSCFHAGDVVGALRSTPAAIRARLAASVPREL